MCIILYTYCCSTQPLFHYFFLFRLWGIGYGIVVVFCVDDTAKYRLEFEIRQTTIRRILKCPTLEIHQHRRHTST